MWFNAGTTGGGYKWYVAGNARMALLNGSLGIGTTAPKASLDVAGTISATGAIQVGTSALTCGSGIPGAMRYNAGSMEYCDGSDWTSFITTSTGANTTTMVSDWPDAIACNSGTARIVMHRVAWWSSGSQRARYSYIGDPYTYYVEYDVDGDVYAKGNLITSASYNDCDNENIATLASEGRTFNFIGGATWSQNAGNGSVYYNGGNVGVGTSTPNQGRLEVKGGSVCVDTNSDDNASTCIASESDARLKQNVKPLQDSLEKIVQLQGVSFDWKVSDSEVLKHYPLIARFSGNPHSIGLIAQDVQKVVPEAIEAETIGDGEVQYLQLDYTKLVPHLINAVKELKAANDNYAARLNAQAREIEALKRAVYGK
jgi:hypothetical protein